MAARCIALAFFLFPFSGFCQDSLRIKRLKIYDCTLFAAFDYIENEKRINQTYIRSFTEHQGHDFNNLAFPDTVSYSLHADPHGKTDGGEFGLSLSFRFQKPEKQFFKRMKPRVDFFYNYKQFFTYDAALTRHFTIDTLKTGNETYVLRDSVQIRHISYSYYSEQLFLQLGFNYEIFTTKYFNIYTGLILGEGVSIKNEFTSQSFDSYRVDEISHHGHPHQGTEITGNKKVYSTNESISHSFRLSSPLGLQYRFDPNNGFSMGFTLEGRLGVEQYVIDKGRNVTHLLFTIGAGLRFSFYSHLREG